MHSLSSNHMRIFQASDPMILPIRLLSIIVMMEMNLAFQTAQKIYLLTIEIANAQLLQIL